MKRNSQTILMSLYSTAADKTIVLSEGRLLELLIPITLSGLRSLLFQLVRKQLIAVQRIESDRRYFLTDQGRSLCERLFPALTRKNGQGEWILLIFVTAPQADAHFHYLRSLCVSNHAVNLARGIYAFSEELPHSVEMACQSLYQGHTIIARVRSFISGFDWNTINDSVGLWDIYTTYSSISRRVDQLLQKVSQQNSLTVSDKKALQSLVNEFMSTMSADTGLVPPKIPEECFPDVILSQLQIIMEL